MRLTKRQQKIKLLEQKIKVLIEDNQGAEANILWKKLDKLIEEERCPATTNK